MTDEAMSPLRRRMIEDMTIRKLAPKTQHDYVQRVKNFAAFLGRSPDMASFEDVRRYQLHLATSGVGVPTINQTVSTLRFFFRVTLKRHDIVEHTHFIHEPLFRGTQIPIAHAAPPTYPFPRFPPLEVCGRRPRARGPTITGPASANLHICCHRQSATPSSVNHHKA